MNDELQSDLNETDVINATDVLEKRHPGRPVGTKNKSTSKTEIRRRVAAHRERKRLAAEKVQEEQAEYETLLKRQREQNLVYFGEVFPGQNAQTAQEELEAASLFASAMSLEPINTGETIRTFVNRVLRNWCEIGTPLLSLSTLKFAEAVKEADPTRFDAMAELVNAYQFPDGSDVPYQEDRTVTNG